MEFSIFTSTVMMQVLITKSHLLFVIGLQFCTEQMRYEAENKHGF